MLISGTFNGTAAAVYICIGFLPDFVKLMAIGDSTHYGELLWDINDRIAAASEGFTIVTGTTYRQIDALAATEGCSQYEGGDSLTATNQTSVSYGEGVYLAEDPVKDYSKNASYGYTSNPIDTWTLDTSAARTGHFNDDCLTSVSRIGAGSRILIKESSSGQKKWAYIEVLTAGQGISADEVTLSRALTSGTIQFIGGKYSFSPMALGSVTPAGFKISDTTVVNENNSMIRFIAGTYDNRS